MSQPPAETAPAETQPLVQSQPKKERTTFLRLLRDLRQRILIEGFTSYFRFPTWGKSRNQASFVECYLNGHQLCKNTYDPHNDYLVSACDWLEDCYDGNCEDIRWKIDLYRTSFGKWSPLLKGDMKYVYGKWKESFQKTKLKQKKQVQKWFDTVSEVTNMIVIITKRRKNSMMTMQNLKRLDIILQIRMRAILSLRGMMNLTMGDWRLKKCLVLKTKSSLMSSPGLTLPRRKMAELQRRCAKC